MIKSEKEITKDDVVGVMLQGGLAICQQCREHWESDMMFAEDDLTGHAELQPADAVMRRRAIKFWIAMESRVKQLAHELLKQGQHL